MSHEPTLVQALSSLPHGPEFRFIHELENLIPGTEATALSQFRGEEPFFVGHFPGQPLIPGVLMVEALAQLVGIIVQSARMAHPLSDVRLTAIRQFKILGSLPPPATLRVHARIDGIMSGLIQATGTITDASTGNPLATGAIILSGTEPV
jgi:3-hydroxyacyl-[acyl-carrier-protein] dehydratase